MMSSRLLSFLLLWGSAALFADVQPFEAVEPHMGTLFRIKLYAGSEVEARAAFRSAFDRIAQLDETLSDYKSSSELNRLTASPAGQPVRVGRDLFRVLNAAQAIALDSDGAFDVTIGSLTHLWRKARKSGHVPDEIAVRDASAKCGFQKMHLDSARQTVVLDQPGMQLDLGGIAKGFAADEAITVLRGLHIASALVAASGDLAFSDAPPGKAGWTVGVDSLDEAGSPFSRVLELKNAAISTSGDTRQFLEAEGKRYSHILDPRTGMGLTHQLTVTVVAPHGMEADALTKVVSVWGREKGLVFIEQRPGVAALIVDRDMSPMQAIASQRLKGASFEPNF